MKCCPENKCSKSGKKSSARCHWVMQRITAVTLIPLSIWLASAIIGLMGADVATARHFFNNPVNSLAMAMFVVAAFWHASLGLEVIIEDYVHNTAAQKATIRIIKLVIALVAAAAVAAIISLTIHAMMIRSV